MTKQELATKIWASTNTLRGNIELGTYKDYMLALLFYKFLSDKEEQYLNAQGWTKEDMPSINEEDTDTVADCQNNIGYFIAYEHLFSTWVASEHDFNVSQVVDGLNAFDRLIGASHKKVFSKIFETLQSNISNLGTTASEQTKALKNLIETINDIPADTTEGYDVLGFIYEFLIGNFAANAGKKAGEFYTPHEVSVLMAEIVSQHLKDRETIKILDPTSGSGSLLITIGKAFAKHSGAKDNVEYYAQEFIKSTYNLTRMNLLMKGILPNNIHVRNGDTLAKDWPFFDDTDPEATYAPLYVDAVVSNPPYSQKWDPKDRESDPRFAGYGVAPKSKADFAFLLYDLYHIRPDGIATIVLPHGVLFRGGSEYDIRKNLIENNKIDAIIGLPANAFYGTSIATILMVLKQNRDNTDVLVIDASKGFVKAGKKNQLQSQHIKRIADTYIGRIEGPKYSRRVPKSEIVENDYNLNIPRYVDSSDGSENWDLYSLMMGGIPNYEIDELEELWEAFPSLRDDIFEPINPQYSRVKCADIKAVVNANVDVQAFMARFNDHFGNFSDWLQQELIADPLTVSVANEQDRITGEIFDRHEGIPLVDPYKAYQILADLYTQIAADLDAMQAEGFDAVRVVDPNMVTKKKDDKTIEVQEGWKGHILPFELVQRTYLAEQLQAVMACENRLNEINAEYEEILGTFDEEELGSDAVNEENTAFVPKEVLKAIDEFMAELSTPAIEAVKGYLVLLESKPSKADLKQYIEEHPEGEWHSAALAANGTITASNAKKHLTALRAAYVFEVETFEAKLLRVRDLMEEEKAVKKDQKEKQKALQDTTKAYIEQISDEEAKVILYQKWISPLIGEISGSPAATMKSFIDKLTKLGTKYSTTAGDLERQIYETENELAGLVGELTGSEYDLIGLEMFRKMLGGD